MILRTDVELLTQAVPEVPRDRLRISKSGVVLAGDTSKRFFALVLRVCYAQIGSEGQAIRRLVTSLIKTMASRGCREARRCRVRTNTCSHI